MRVNDLDVAGRLCVRGLIYLAGRGLYSGSARRWNMVSISLRVLLLQKCECRMVTDVGVFLRELLLAELNRAGVTIFEKNVDLSIAGDECFGFSSVALQ